MKFVAPAAFALLLSGCLTSHGQGRDGDAPDGSVDDGSTRDGGGSTCGFVGEWRMCAELCDQPCPDETGCFAGSQLVCIPFQSPGCGFGVQHVRRGGRLVTLPTTPNYCHNGELCAVRTDGPGREGFGGTCLGEEYCRDARELGLDQVCIYSDRSFLENGPPDEGACPARPEGGSPFCGEACGGCPDESFTGNPAETVFPICRGVSERRGFGICATGSMRDCSREDRVLGTLCEGWLGEPCACIVFERPDEDGFYEAGNILRRESCLAYRARYPGQVECYDATDWTVLE